MGNSESVRATHFQRPDVPADPVEDDLPDEHHISISNKMVERLVEDATLTGAIDTSASHPRGDFKEKMFMEQLKSLDEKHTDRFGLTVRELNAVLKRVELRTTNMVNVDPVCADIKRKIIDCYDSTSTPAQVAHCWDTIG
ncbi:jg13970 [Pararge aegeria aegeria]|uniref:Jg13970 protein n=1 Tax=Pararge aegeria aegeria TaxID=348720 RepID=A0A8S4RDR1_9NEOP|nr:jg13970 [Pararge aegeria aegeria]